MDAVSWYRVRRKGRECHSGIAPDASRFTPNELAT